AGRRVRASTNVSPSEAEGGPLTEGPRDAPDTPRRGARIVRPGSSSAGAYSLPATGPPSASGRHPRERASSSVIVGTSRPTVGGRAAALAASAARASSSARSARTIASRAPYSLSGSPVDGIPGAYRSCGRRKGGDGVGGGAAGSSAIAARSASDGPRYS